MIRPSSHSLEDVENGFCKSDQKSIPVVGFLTCNDCDVLRAKTGGYRRFTHRAIIPPTPSCPCPQCPPPPPPALSPCPERQSLNAHQSNPCRQKPHPSQNK